MSSEKELNAAEEKLLWKKERKALLPVFATQVFLSAALCFGVLYGGYYFCDCIPVPRSSDLGDKLTYYIRCCVFPCSVVLCIAIQSVANKRGQSMAANPLAGREHKVVLEKNVLTNTVEQTMLFLMITLVLTTYLNAAEMKIIPLYSVLWVIGRVFFRIGYAIHPRYRSFGVVTTLFTAPIFLILVGYLMYTRGFMYGIPSEAVGTGEAATPSRAEL